MKFKAGVLAMLSLAVFPSDGNAACWYCASAGVNKYQCQQSPVAFSSCVTLPNQEGCVISGQSCRSNKTAIKSEIEGVEIISFTNSCDSSGNRNS